MENVDYITRALNIVTANGFRARADP